MRVIVAAAPIVLMAALCSLPSSVALATPAEDSPRAEARRHYESGLAHFNLREYPQAVEDFQAAYRLRPDPVFLYNLGQSYRLANDPDQALYFYRAYLRTSESAPNRREVEDRIAVLEKLMADKQKLATPPDQALSPDAKAPAAEKPAASTPAAAVVVTAPPPEPKRTPVYKRWWLWTAVGVVAAGAAVGIGVGIASQKSATFNANAGTVGPAALSVVRW
jgi:tetratricopeptide (TPR) repeat protein